MLKIGDIVRVVKCEQYHRKYEGLTGEIIREYKGMFGVLIEGHENHASSYGCYWFRKCQIAVFFDNKESEDESIMLGVYRTALISFLDDGKRECASRYALYDNFEVGDVVVVKTGHHGLQVATIASIDETVGRVTNEREIIAKVDLTDFNKRVETRKRVSELKTAMDVRINKLQKMAVLEMFSEKDAEMKALLDEYKSLTE